MPYCTFNCKEAAHQIARDISRLKSQWRLSCIRTMTGAFMFAMECGDEETAVANREK